MIDRQIFVERRRSGIGGSDIAAIVGLSPWATAYDVWRSKVDPDTEREAATSASLAVELGVELEDFAARKFTEVTGLRVRRCNHMFRCPGAEVFAANLDRVIIEDGAPVVRGELRTRSILECKTASRADEWGEPWTDAIPEHYKCQVQWEMGVTGAARCYVSVVFLTMPYRHAVYLVERDDDLIAYLFSAGGQFWRDYVETKTPPPPQTYEDAARRWSGTADVCTADAELSQLLDLYRAATAERKEAERREDAIKAQICGRMGDCVVLATASGRKLASWSASKEAVKVDYKGIVEELSPDPAIIQKYSQTYNTARRFTLAGK